MKNLFKALIRRNFDSIQHRYFPNQTLKALSDEEVFDLMQFMIEEWMNESPAVTRKMVDTIIQKGGKLG